MKSISIVLLLCCATLVSCKMKSGEETSALDSTAVIDSVAASSISIEEPHNPWIIPLTNAWKDPEHFVLLVPDSSREFEFWEQPAFSRYTEIISDTAQGKFSKTAKGMNNCGEKLFYEITLDRGGARSHGWATDGDILLMDKKELGKYVIGERRLQFGTMKPRENFYGGNTLNEDCRVLHTLFFYNDKYLYLIDATSGQEEDVRWHKESHLTIVNQFPGISITGKQQGKDFVIRWGEPNVQMEMLITWDNDHLKYLSYEVKPMSDVDDLEVEEAAEGETKTETVTFLSAGIGDCFHLEFSTGDFGNANNAKLQGADIELWNDLTVEDKEGNITANPKYVNKEFEMTYYYSTGEVCGEFGPNETSTEVQTITSFKLKK